MRNQGNEFIRDVFELGPPMLVDSATMKAMKISRFERVRINSVADSAPIILIASFKVLLIKLYHIPPSASPQLCCVQGQDQGQEQVQGQEGGRGRVLTFSSDSNLFMNLSCIFRGIITC